MAERTAERVNAKIHLGTYGVEIERQQLDQERAAFEAARKRHEGGVWSPLPCEAALRRWHETHRVTMAPAYEVVTRGLIEHHLVPYFRSRDLRELRRDDMLGFIDAKLNERLSVSTIRNALSILRGVIYIECEEGRMTRNPAARIGAMIRRADRRTLGEVRRIESWNRAELEALLTVAREHEPRFAPVLHFLLATGARRGEALALRWEDVDFSSRQITICRAITQRRLTTPKSGKARTVAMAGGLAADLFDLGAQRRVEAMRKSWPEVPPWVFCSEAGTPWDERNLGRAWARVRRRAQKIGVRPFKLHTARHTFATLALEAGRSVRWVAEQLGHSDPALMLRVYAHALRSNEADLAFVDFGSTVSSRDRGGLGAPESVSSRLQTAPDSDGDIRSRNSL